MMAMPLLASVAHQFVDLLLGADVDAAVGSSKIRMSRFRCQRLGQDDLLLVAAAQVNHLLLEAGES